MVGNVSDFRFCSSQLKSSDTIGGVNVTRE